MAGEYRMYRTPATVPPQTVSGSHLRLGTDRFHRAITAITPMNETALRKKAVPTPAAATMKPANPGPIARAKLNLIPFNAEAAGRSSFGTTSGKTARQVGVILSFDSKRHLRANWGGVRSGYAM